MKKPIITLLLSLVPLSLFGASGTAIPGGNQTTAFIITKPGAYYLAANRVMTNKVYGAIQVQAPDVTIDLNGCTISFSDTNGGSAHGITSFASNLEIRNGTISTIPSYAITSTGDGLRVIDVRVADALGINSEGEAALIERCHIIDSRTMALYVIGWGSVVKGCTIKNTKTHGLWLGSFGTAIGNSIGYTGGSGIIAYGTNCVVKENHVYRANTVLSSSAEGIAVSGEFAIISDNVVTGAYGTGIRISEHGAVLEKNVVTWTHSASPQLGIAIVSGMNSPLLRGNLGRGNVGGFVVGAYVDGGNNLGN